MCGILGRINFHNPVEINQFTEMLDTMIHRGPDDSGNYFSKDKLVALGHRRLSIVDLTETGKQPIHNENKTIWLTVNGEIYNANEIRTKLINSGHVFYTKTDSEVIVHGYEEWGAGVLDKLKGMFAFAIWDENKKKMFLARDRFGIKPLYYYNDSDCFIFASEIKAIIKDPTIKRNIDFSSFADFFVYRYIPSPKTIWEDLHKVPPAHLLEFDADRNVNIKEYWNISPGNLHCSDADAVEKTSILLEQSIKEHLNSDVKVGCFLSGGYDSSSIVYLLNKLNYKTKVFSVGFENWNKSETQYAKIVANKFSMDYHEKILEQNGYDVLEKLMYYYDEPIADISIIPTYEVCNLASLYVKTALSGEGADEIFGGYNWHKSGTELPVHIMMYRLKNRIFNNQKTFSTDHYKTEMSMGLFGEANLKKMINPFLHNHIHDSYWFYKKHFKPDISGLKAFQYMDIKCFMAELVLTKMDRASMANSLEVRVPFLDHELVELLFNFDEKVYYKKHITKFLIHEMIKNKMPDEILKRKKQGFVGPDKFYKNFKWYKELLLNGKLISDKIFQTKFVEEMIGRKDHWRLWKMAVMEIWYSKWKA
ncbi:MAG: asparagine synthase (glutamine-hydrolyzing) [Bacteroidota bacterium]